jgi:ATP-binding cassette subfamily C protein CydCD
MYFDRRLWAFTKGVRWRIAAAILVGLAAALTGIVRLALLGWLLARVFQGDGLGALALPIAVVALVMVARGWLEYWRAMIAHRTAARVQSHIRGVLHDKIAELGPAHFGLTRTGDAILSMVDGIEQLETFFGQYLPQLCVAALTPIAIFGLLFMVDLPVAAVLVGFALLTLVAPAAFHRLDQRGALARQRAYGDFGSEFLDSIQGLGTLKAYGQSGARTEALSAKAHALFKSTMWVLATNALARGITDTGIAVGAAVALIFGASRVIDGSMSIEALLIVLMTGTEIFRPLRDLRTVLHTGMMGQAAAGAVFSLLDAEPLVKDAAANDNRELDHAQASIVFDAVTFGYPGSEEPTLAGLSFTITPGERIGIVGPSGAGKSSIVRLLLRLYDPDDGAITIGGDDIRSLSMAALRAQYAIVSQDTYLFHGTVEDNLRLGKPDASHAELQAAARAANAEEFIDRLPEGYQTVIGERGLRLSGGQRQRIAIARALLRDAPILILDEALSSVDGENEAVIQQALDRLMRTRTTLILAHRLSSVIHADRILVLSDGHIAESGNHADLMAGQGLYAQLMAEQVRDRRGIDEPSIGVLPSATETTFDPTAVLDDPEPADEIIRAEGLTWLQATAELLKLVVPWRGKLMLTFVFGVCRVAAFIGVGVISALIVAAVKDGRPIDGYILPLLMIAPAAGILHWLESWIAHDMAFRLLSEMRIALFRVLDRLAPAYLLRRRSGDLVALATQDIDTVEYFFAHTIAPAFVAVLVPAVVLVSLGVAGWPLAVALLPFLVIVAVSPIVMRGRIDRLGARAREALGELNAYGVDTIQGLAEIVSFQRVPERRRKLIALTDRLHRARLAFFSDLTFQAALVEVATGLGGLAVVTVGASLAASGTLDSGLLPLLTLIAMAAFLPISEIASVGRQLADTLASSRRLYSIHNEPVTITPGPVKELPSRAAGADIEIDHVDFAYRGGAIRAIEDARLSIRPGETTALVGPSGAGKSTLAHLIMRFWDPDRGQVRLNGIALDEIDLDVLRDQVALVAQDTYLFNATLRANILLARPEATPEMVDDAVEKAALGDFVRNLPTGLDTPVGERGMRLSGGQRQRVSIARAFLKDAPVLILDEATSHLDALSEQAVRRALALLMANRTTVVIAHRLSTVREADRIAVLNRGRIVEVGSHAELRARGGLYAHLVASQLTAGSAAAGS